MNHALRILSLLIVLLTFNNFVEAQVDKTIKMCDNYIIPPFVSDGQEYRALLKNDELAEFNVTFYGGSTYRIAACSGTTEGNLVFSVYDKDRNLIFTNRDFQNSPYWDFKIKNTINLVIEAELIGTTANQSGFAFLQIGFKQ
jgi:hypothetical protein